MSHTLKYCIKSQLPSEPVALHRAVAWMPQQRAQVTALMKEDM
jgi:hypothetical protein